MKKWRSRRSRKRTQMASVTTARKAILIGPSIGEPERRVSMEDQLE